MLRVDSGNKPRNSLMKKIGRSQKMKLKIKKTWLITALLPAFAILILIFPIQSFTLASDGLLRFAGVDEGVENGIQYFERNMCQDQKNCQCVLFVHGLSDTYLTWAKFFLKSSDSFLNPLHFYAINTPGTMGSSYLKKREDYNVTKMSEQIIKTFSPKCKSWVVVGNSFGGWMAVQMALIEPKIRGLFLLDPAGLKKDYSHILNHFLNPTVESTRNFYHMAYARPYPLPDFVFKMLAERMKRLPIVEELQEIKNGDYLDHGLLRLKVPVQYIWGAQDRVIPTAWAKEYQEITRNSEISIAPDCGHIPQKECFPETLKLFNNLLLKISTKMKTN